jgi:hypothetical protein
MLSLAALAGCGRFGHVNQGQVIDYQRGAGVLTLIQDSSRTAGQPVFGVLPPVTIRIPEDPREMGPEPEAGKLLQLDWRNHRAVVYDAAGQTLRTVAYTPISEERGVAPADPRVAKARLPLVDRDQKTVTLYSPRDRVLVAFSAADEYLALPDDTWKMGDQVRYYYKDPQRALRLMNVSRTDLNKGGK